MPELEARKRIVEQLLYDLATELRCVPVRENTRSLHLRALALKRVVRGWSTAPPPPETFTAVESEVRELLEAARGGMRAA